MSHVPEIVTLLLAQPCPAARAGGSRRRAQTMGISGRACRNVECAGNGQFPACSAVPGGGPGDAVSSCASRLARAENVCSARNSHFLPLIRGCVLGIRESRRQ
jgi:hypothetical protein